jgi:hypothetical protein
MGFSAHRIAISLFFAVLMAWLIGMAVVMRHAALPAEASGPMLVVFEPGTSDDAMFASLTRAGARIIRQSGLAFVWVVAGEEPGLAGRLAQEGALGAYRELPLNPAIAGCFALADAKMATLTP